jgi:TRAP-type C4-dicarboxylate transport system substrate-binding protein
MKKTVSVMLVLTLILVTGLSACGSSGNSGTTAPAGGASTEQTEEVEAVEISFSIHDPAASLKGQLYQQWVDDVNAASNGSLNVTLYAGGTLAAQDVILEALDTGVCDIGLVYTTFYPSLFGLTDVIALPMLGIENATQGTNALWDLYDASPEMKAEYDDYQLIQMYTNPVSYLNFATKPVSSIADMNGLKVRCAGGTMVDFIKGTGAAPITLSLSEVYEAVEKKTIDGFVQNGSGMTSWNLQDVTPYYIDMPLYVGTWLILMNKDKYESLSDQQKAAIDAFSGRASSLVQGATAQSESDEVYSAAVADGKGEWVPVSAAEKEKFFAIAKDVAANWASGRTTADFDAQAYYDRALEIVSKANKG